ncbi:hypothetical protein CCR75_008105 [Bremia lactucae]|uniref:Uncharacterized protein n=1 Tax=Bremia lactucae TaxID=4779 RepID=A0A976FMA4_BRELC|nr:hypothetical protein CCR75_008105 [Bremia lactucae]
MARDLRSQGDKLHEGQRMGPSPSQAWKANYLAFLEQYMRNHTAHPTKDPIMWIVMNDEPNADLME